MRKQVIVLSFLALGKISPPAPLSAPPPIPPDILAPFCLSSCLVWRRDTVSVYVGPELCSVSTTSQWITSECRLPTLQSRTALGRTTKAFGLLSRTIMFFGEEVKYLSLQRISIRGLYCICSTIPALEVTMPVSWPSCHYPSSARLFSFLVSLLC